MIEFRNEFMNDFMNEFMDKYDNNNNDNGFLANLDFLPYFLKIEDREMQLTENLIEHREPITDDLLPIEHREPFTDDLRPHTEFHDIPVGQNLQTSRPGVTAL